MSPGKHLVHLRYCRFVTDDDDFDVEYEGVSYKLFFKDHRFKSGTGYLVARMDGHDISSDLLLWLSIYTGEDALNPFQEVDTRFLWERGDFNLDRNHLQRFLRTAETSKNRSWPRWKRELFDDALVYFSVAARSGINYMPLNCGFFALSLECLGNVRYGKRDKHWTFGENKFLNYLTPRLAKLKRDTTQKPNIRAFEKRLRDDIELLMVVRNSIYGHSLLHLREDRKRLVDLLRKWATRNGMTKKFALLSFRSNRLKDDLTREAAALYKLGLRLNRLFIFLALGFSRTIPFATHDWAMLGDQRDDEESEYRGVKMRVRVSVQPAAQKRNT